MIRPIIAIGLTAIGLHATAASAQNLVTNGSFETNPLASGQYRDMLVGSDNLPGWTIIGVQGTYVTQVEKNYAGNPGYTFSAQDGNIWLDLAGYSDNAANGVQQTVATTIGASYDFNFYVGNITGGQYFGTQSLVNVVLNGVSFSCVNTAQTFTMTWQSCGRSFVATSTSTTFSISNGDPTSDFSNAIDNVTLQLSASISGVPEPATWASIIGGFGAMGGVLRRRKRPLLATAS